MQHNIKRVEAPKFNSAEGLKHLNQKPTGTLTTSLFQGSQSIQQTALTAPGKQPTVPVSTVPVTKVRDQIVAYDPVSHKMMNNAELYDRYKDISEKLKNEELVENQSPQEPGKSEPQVMFTAIITRELKTKYDCAYKNYKDNLCDASEIEVSNVKEQMISQVNEYFSCVRSQVTHMRTSVNQRVKQSKSLKELEQLIDVNQEYFGENPGADLAKEKEKFDKKLDRCRFAGIVKRQQFYKDLIATLDKADQHMKATIDEAQQYLHRVVQVDEEVDLKTETITKKIIEDSIMIDLDEKQIELKNQAQAETNCLGMQVDEIGDGDMLQVPQNEFSLFSANVSANSCFFQNPRNIKNSQVFILKNRQYILHDSSTKSKKVLGACDRYHVSMALLPGKGQCLIVGGSQDAEGKLPSNTVQIVSQDGTVTLKKQISQARGQIGLCVGELKSESNAQFHKTYAFAFGGIDKDGKLSKITEKYNVKANIWQSMPDLVVPRAKASGCIIGDFLYVFGGVGGSSTIERLNLKLNKVRTGDKFEQVDAKLPSDAYDIGVIPQLNSSEVLLIGGFNDSKCLNQILKFSAVPFSADDGSQQNIEYSIEEVPKEENTQVEMKADFFSCNSMILTDHENPEVVTIFGAQFKHSFVGLHIGQSDALC